MRRPAAVRAPASPARRPADGCRAPAGHRAVPRPGLVSEGQVAEGKVQSRIGAIRSNERRAPERSDRGVERAQAVLGQPEAEQGLGPVRMRGESVGEPRGGLLVAPFLQGDLAGSGRRWRIR